MFNGKRQLDLYQWWARQWAGEDRLEEIGDVEEVDRLVNMVAGGTRNRGL